MAYKVTSTDINNWYKKLNFARTQSGIGLSSITELSYTKNQTSDRIKALINNISSSRSNTFLGMSDYSIDINNFDDGDDILNIDRNSINNTLLSLLRICPNINCQTVCNNTGTNSNTSNENGTCNNVIQTNGKNSDGVCNNGLQTNGTTTTTNSNGNSNASNTNGTKSNGTASTTNSNGKKSNGSCNNACYEPGYSCADGGGCDAHCSYGKESNGTNSNGTASTTNSNGKKSNGNSNAVNSNGNTNLTCNNGMNSLGLNSYGTCTNGTKSNGTNTNGNKSNGCTDKIYDPNTVTYSAKNHYTEEEANNRVQNIILDLGGSSSCNDGTNYNTANTNDTRVQ